MARRVLSDRLRALEATGRNPARSSNGSLRESLPYLPLADRHLPVEHQLVGGVCLRRLELPLDYRHGRLSLADGLAASPAALACAGRSAALAEVSPSRAVFFDTETTALAGGSGVYLFLIGLGFVEGDRFVLEQYFLRDASEEAPMLSAVRQRLAGAGCVVTFAGKSFDRPRLLDRLAMCGLHPRLEAGTPAAPVIPRPLHLDLLHPSRALWRRAQADVRLASLERHRLGLVRQGDLPGALCPVAYFDYLRGRPARLPAVFAHNGQDILSMVVLLAEVAAALVAPRSLSELLGAAHLHEHAGLPERAAELWDRAIAGLPAGDPERPAALRRRAQLAKQQGEHSAALRAWEELALYPAQAPWALEQLAITHDRHLADPGAARAAAQRALEHAHRTGDREAAHALQLRLARLERKLAAAAQTDPA